MLFDKFMTNRPIGDTLTVKVVKIIGAGAIVEFDRKDSAFLHISEISNKYVKQVGDVLKIGQEIQVTLIDKKDGKTFVSMKNTVQKEDKKVSFEERIQSFLKESTENLRQIQKQQDKKRGIYKKRPTKNNN
ncbi:S1 domain-containing RNA-binding protein [Bacillus cereus]|uniref:RNA-binding protein n=1 Tax=Bacillus thuringiensis TaxID=1428 RepID=A0A9X6ZPV7_BACTU|nr:RNA-binding protein [Bacillus thuringiensis]PGP12568.1 RNA-binding protein [Bacillus cereus]